MTPRLAEDPHPIVLVARDPELARLAAERVLAEDRDPEARSAALRVLGLARFEQGDDEGAHQALRRAAASASRSGAERLAAEARETRRGLLARRAQITPHGQLAPHGQAVPHGQSQIAPHAQGAGAPVVADPAQVRALAALNLGVAESQRGRFDVALAHFDTAAPYLAADERLLSGLLSNRGLALLYSGHFDAAEDDLAAALAITERHCLGHLHGLVLQNLGCAAVRRGDTGAAMEHFHAAARTLPASRLPSVRLDQAEALLTAGLARDAAALISTASPIDRTRSADADYAAALLLRAKLHAARGEPAPAVALAHRVRSRFGAASAWSALARQIAWSSRFVPAAASCARSAPGFRPPHGARPAGPATRGPGIPPPVSMGRSDSDSFASPSGKATRASTPTSAGSSSGESGTPSAPAAAGSAAGAPSPSSEAGDSGDSGTGTSASPVSEGAASRGSWDGPVGADRFPVSGVDPGTRTPLPRWAGALPHTAGTARALAARVAATAIGPNWLAYPDRGHAEVLTALARGDHRRALRALRLCAAPAQSTSRHLELRANAGAAEDAVLALGTLTALRAGDAEAALEWSEYRTPTASAPGACRDPEWGSALDRARAARTDRGRGSARPGAFAPLGLEQWHPGCRIPASATPGPAPAAPVAAPLHAALGTRVLVRYLRTHDMDAVVAVADGRVTAHHLPRSALPPDAVAKLAHTARAHAISPDTGLETVLRHQAARVDELLFGPIGALIGRRPLVLAPSPSLLAVPWGLLPRLRDREVAVVPSARAWLGCARRGRPPHPARVLLVAGDAVPGSADELAALRALHPQATVLAGPAATAPAVLAAMENADIAHIAAHGTFSPDAPMASGLSLPGGPLLAYDLERVDRVPALTVLSSCWAGRSGAGLPGRPLGLAATLLGRGAAAVVAGVLPVRDHAMAEVMSAAHGALASGVPIGRVVAEHLAAAGFLCFGSG